MSWVCFLFSLEQVPGSLCLPGGEHGRWQTRMSSFSVTALMCSDSGTRPQNLGNTYYCPVLSPDCSLVGSFDQDPLFRNSPHSRPCDSPFTHPLISCIRPVYSMKPFLTPSAPVPSPNHTERGPLLASPRGHLQISTITPNLPHYNWRYFHVYPHACELSKSIGSA